MANQDDLIIIKEILAGGSQAYTTVVNKYKDMAVSLAYNILLNREDAEEVAQDAFVRAYASLRCFKGDAKFSTWIYRIIVNTSLNKKKTKKYHSAELTESLKDKLSDGATNNFQNQNISEQKKYISLALRSLKSNERICITLYYLNELSVAEINQVTGITIFNIKILLYRARKNLYKSLHHYLKSEITNLI